MEVLRDPRRPEEAFGGRLEVTGHEVEDLRTRGGRLKRPEGRKDSQKDKEVVAVLVWGQDQLKAVTEDSSPASGGQLHVPGQAELQKRLGKRRGGQNSHRDKRPAS